MTALVVIGASAGGVAALTQLAAGFPSDFPASVLIVLHIGAHRSQLPALLAQRSPLPVKHADDGEPLRQGRIYVAPPDRHLLVLGDRLMLSKGPKENHCRPAIDPLFRSAAIAHRGDVIGVVLTGMLDDGTAGLQAIKRFGGVAVVQDPKDAYEPSMPQSALENVEVDHCVPLAAMPQLLASLVVRPPSMGSRPEGAEADAIDHEQAMTLHTGEVMEHLKAIGKPSNFTCPECHGDLWEVLDSQPPRYRCHTGHGFTERSLQQSLFESGDRAVWNAMRALEERWMLLEQMAARERARGRGEQAARLDTMAQYLREQSHTLKSIVEATPTSIE